MKEYIANQECYLLCHNGVDVFHCVHLLVGNKSVTGQPNMEKFDTVEELKERVNEISGDPEYFDNNFPEGSI
jgi:hypothetical protein